ncbi:grasp-with-spasm system SPASM domain peptide maturase [Flavobacterium terrae]|uniref:SPASM domain peptide maturase, grasp-with-spasm system n=1 Tax=Flavobacterium terrae TaxID=415425 RepID=A0A1M6B9Z6_9FLAO|nr:grasp-with-spasm system SPASM domain peptide maturase [Flavobacterium terrae]SHI45549.1 SPASM domain peptide maturase, grasp-with-spasm system [Flavobacterium terrae]
MVFFKLFANCIAVKGANRSLIVDLQKNSSHLIPNDMYEVLTKSDKIEISQLYAEYGEDNYNTIKDYFENLEELEIGFFCSENELNLFPELNLEFHYPFLIGNSILEGIDEIRVYEELIPQLEKLGCEYVEIILYQEIENNLLQSILDLFQISSIKHIGLIIKYDVTKDEKFLKKLTSTCLRLSKIILHSSVDEKLLEFKSFNLTYISYVKKELKSFNFCGVVDQGYFSTKMLHFTESQNHNTCLNRKISIDKDGNIKNCPSMKEIFGNIKEVSLEEVLNQTNFKRYWSISKNQIEVCKDCEFRHICTDCRAYTENPEDQYSKPLKCGYNPYTNVWEEWSTNPLKEKAIAFYEMSDLIKR